MISHDTPVYLICEEGQMPAQLVHNAYGKSLVRLTKVTRHAERHDLKELTVAIQLQGEFSAAYTEGDNRPVIPTDTMKNTVYALARHHSLTTIEEFAHSLARHFLSLQGAEHVAAAKVEIVEQAWQRLMVQGQEHPHAFAGGGDEKRTCTVQATRQQTHTLVGIDDLLLLKTTDSAFRDFPRVQYTTLKDADDRIFATILQAQWHYRTAAVAWDQCHAAVRRALLETFATHRSLGVQHTLYAMGEAALAQCADLEEIRITMPNKHRLLVDLTPFAMDNPNAVFVPTEEPHGLISGTLRRSEH